MNDTPSAASRSIEVLILEPDEKLAGEIVSALTEAVPGTSGAIARSVGEAQDLVMAQKPKLFVLDIDTVSDSAQEFIYDLRTSHPDARAIILTGGHSIAQREQVAALGAMHFLEKPFPRADFMALVEALLGSGGSEDSSRFQGTLSDLHIADIIQLKCISGVTSMLEFTGPRGEKARVYFEQGQVRHATAPGLEGRAAFNEIVDWKGGLISEVPVPDDVPRTIDLDWQVLLMEAVRNIDETRGSAAAEPAGKETGGSAGKRVLVIDDSVMLLSFVKEILGDENYRVKTAATAAEGLQAAQTEAPDLILLDYVLPDMKGDEVCRSLVGNPATAKVPIVYMSGFGSDLQPNQSESPNVIGSLSKPFTSDSLLSAVSKYLQAGAQQGASMKEPTAASEASADAAGAAPAEATPAPAPATAAPEPAATPAPEAAPAEKTATAEGAVPVAASSSLGTEDHAEKPPAPQRPSSPSFAESFTPIKITPGPIRAIEKPFVSAPEPSQPDESRFAPPPIKTEEPSAPAPTPVSAPEPEPEPISAPAESESVAAFSAPSPASAEARPDPAMMPETSSAYFCGDSSFFSLHWALQTIAQEKLTGSLRAFWAHESVELLARDGKVLLVTTRAPELYCPEAPVTLLNVERERIDAAKAEQARSGQPLFITLAKEDLILREPGMQLVHHYGQRLFAQLWAAERVRFVFEQQELPGFARELSPTEENVDQWALSTLRFVQYHELGSRGAVDPTCIPAYTRDGYERVQQLRLTDAEAQFASQFNGSRSVAQISKNLRLDIKFARLTLFRFLALEIVDCWPAQLMQKNETRGVRGIFGR